MSASNLTENMGRFGIRSGQVSGPNPLGPADAANSRPTTMGIDAEARRRWTRKVC